MKWYTFAGILLASIAAPLAAQQPPADDSSRPKAAGAAADAAAAARFEKFAAQLSNVKLVGRFSITGKDDRPLAKEEYTIRKVEKLPDGDKWLFMCRIKYGKHDVEVPLPIDVLWAGETPIITLDELTIPGLGTFSARVVIHDQKYAGMWRHDQVGGHLFGTIEKIESPEETQ